MNLHGRVTAMGRYASERSAQFYAQTYDVSVGDWPGEIAFYQEFASRTDADGQAILELACGTGRIAVRLAKVGCMVVGLDVSGWMLDEARKKSMGVDYVRWVQADMRSFELDETFGLVIMPGHSFQNILTPADQVACLESVKRHLTPGGRLILHIDHLDVSWLGALMGDEGGVYKTIESFTHPKTGRQILTFRAWSYEPATQTAISQTVWEEVDADGEVTDRWESGPLRFHCVFRFEMEHLLERTGFRVEGVYGDFFRREFSEKRSEMVWVASNR